MATLELDLTQAKLNRENSKVKNREQLIIVITNTTLIWIEQKRVTVLTYYYNENKYHF